MIHRQLDDRVLCGRQDLPQFIFPLLPLVAAPEVVRPEEATLRQIRAQRSGFLTIEDRASRRGHDDERALEERVGVVARTSRCFGSPDG